MADQNKQLQICTQRLSGETIVSLYTIDASDVGAGVYRITNMTDGNNQVSFGGLTFTPIPLYTEGWEMNSVGSLPRPKMKVSTISPLFNALIRGFDNGIGSIVYRQRTYARFLDGHETPDATAQFMVDMYRIDKKTDEYAGMVEWELASPFDVEGAKIPARQMFRDTCSHVYRRWNGAKFEYGKVTCPYAGDTYYKADGTVTLDPAEDKCGKKLSDCKLRFGENGNLPTRAFPGIAKVRVG